MVDLSIYLNRTLAADRRYAQIDLKNDQVWEFSCAHNEPPALAIQSTYGLNCQGIKIFPRFTLQGTTLTDPRTFARSVHIEKRLTNYLLATCSPFSLLDVELEYWVPSSNSVCGRVRLINRGKSAISLNLEWAVLLKPKEGGQTMTSAEMGVNTILRGKTAELYPVFFLTGGPVPSTRAYPALSLEMTLPAGAERRVTWALATLDSHEASFTLARQNTALLWDSELLKHEMDQKRKTFLFISDDLVMNELLYETQVKAHQCLIQGKAPERRLTLLSKRQPDAPLGTFMISPITKRSNLPATIYDLWQISRILLPAEPELFKELIQGFLDNQQENGAIPWTIKPNGSPSIALTPPLLAGIALDTADCLQDNTWLSQVYAPLLEGLKYWFHSNSKDIESGWPVWDHLMQTGLDSSPLYSIWKEEDQGVDLSYIDSPALGAMLYHECCALIKISQKLDKPEEISWLQVTAERIREHVQSSWNEKKATYLYRDIRSSQTGSTSDCFQAERDGTYPVEINCDSERRLLVRCTKKGSLPENAAVTLHGKNLHGAVMEEFQFSKRQFQQGIVRLTSSSLFSTIEKIEVTGLHEEDQISVSLVGFDDEDISLLLPLWAGIPTAKQAKRLVTETLMKRYLSPLGLSVVPSRRYAKDHHTVQSFWNSILVEGMLNYGMREQAAKVLFAFLGAVRGQWENNFVLNDTIRVTDSQGVGDRDNVSALPGVVPLLRCLGMEQVRPNEVIFSGLNEFLPAFTVQYGRTSVYLNKECTKISTLNGSKIEIHDAGKQRIVLP
jgi:hypothetical protein